MAATKNKPRTEAEEAQEAFEETIRTGARGNVTIALAERNIFRDHGFTYVDTTEDPPLEKLNTNTIKARIFELLPDLIVNTTDDNRIHRYALAGKILTNLPAMPPYGDLDEWEALDGVTHRAWHKAEQRVWKMVDDRFTGTLQRKVREDMAESYVLIKTDSHLYITDEPKLVQHELWRPLTDKGEVAMVAAAEQIALFEKQLPALKGRGMPALRAANKRAGQKAEAAYTLLADTDNNGNGGE